MSLCSWLTGLLCVDFNFLVTVMHYIIDLNTQHKKYLCDVVIGNFHIVIF